MKGALTRTVIATKNTRRSIRENDSVLRFLRRLWVAIEGTQTEQVNSYESMVMRLAGATEEVQDNDIHKALYQIMARGRVDSAFRQVTDEPQRLSSRTGQADQNGQMRRVVGLWQI
jgi:hypothetical protein